MKGIAKLREKLPDLKGKRIAFLPLILFLPFL